MRVGDKTVEDPLAKNESLELVKLYWKLSTDAQREAVIKMLKAMNGQD
jgi:hypothetical protein